MTYLLQRRQGAQQLRQAAGYIQDDVRDDVWRKLCVSRVDGFNCRLTEQGRRDLIVAFFTLFSSRSLRTMRSG